MGDNTPAMKDINLKVSEGSFATILGPNAAGKTTLLETIIGLLSSKGEKKVFGKDIETHGRKLRQKMGYVPQDFDRYTSKNFLVKDVVMMGRYGKIGLLHPPQAQDKQHVMEAMKFVEISHLAEKPLERLSGGQKQRVFLARALVKRPKLLLLDEPLSSIDLTSQHKIMERLILMYENRSITIFMVTHEFTRIPEQTDLLVIMNKGRILLCGHPKEVVQKPVFQKLYGERRLEW